MGGNDGKARVLLTQDVVRAAAEPREQPRKAPIAELASALRAHACSAVNQLPKSVVRQIRMPRSVGTGGGRPPPVTRWALSNERPPL
jgi:hypothetical protein